MRVLITGVGDAFTARHFGTSAVIEAPSGPVLLDCPDLIHRVLREASEASGWSVTATDIDDILLTHLHGDHCNGLESFGFRRRFHRSAHPDEAPPRVHTTEPVAARLWERLAPAMDGSVDGVRPSALADYYDVRVMAVEETAIVAGLAIRCRFTTHPIPTIGLLISDGDVTLGWSGDTPFEAAHVAWLKDADLIVHESNLGGAHTPIEALNDLPEGLRRRMRLIHLPDDFDEGRTDIRPLRQGEVLEIEPRG